MRIYKLCITVIIAVLTVTSAAYAGFGPSEPIVSTKTLLSVDKLRPGDSFQVAVQATVQKGYHVGAHDKDALYPAKLTLSAPKGIAFDEPNYPAAVQATLKISPDKKIPVYEGAFVITAIGHVSRDAKLGSVTIVSKLDTQGCADDECYPPSVAASDVKSAVALSKPNNINASVFEASAATTNGAASQLGGNGAGATDAQRMFARLAHANVFVRLIFIFVAGLMLSLTPCVYPMIPVTVGYFSGQGDKRAKSVAFLASTYVLGLAFTYSVLGAVAATTGGMIGSAMQKPAVLIGIAVVLVGLALSMFGLYELQPPAFITKHSHGKTGHLGALFMGMIFGVVCAPCVGPFVLGLALYVAHVGSPLVGFVLFFVLALGLGTPLFFLAAFSAELPTPGMWMVAVKKVAGFLLIGAAAYFVLPIAPTALARYLIPLVVVAAGIYMGFIDKSIKASKMTSSFGKVFGCGALAVAVVMMIPKANASTHLKWQPYPNNAQYALSAGKPIMIDFTARWCGACRELEHGPFSNPAVIRAAAGFRRFQVDGTDQQDEKILALEKHYGVQGFPTIIFLDRSGREVTSARINGFIDSKEMIQRFKSVRR